ncbi:MAG: thioredoxin [Verrucomicrobia bacterium]|nr:thioredoxin [Verrucomicrobiota bacterium]
MVIEVSDFENQVIRQSQDRPVVVDFWAPWCAPCRMLGPTLEKLAQEAAGRWILAKVNTEEQPEIAMRYQISGIPAVKLFHRGEVVDEFVGALPEPEVRRWLRKALPSPRGEQLARAEALMNQGVWERAAQELEAVLEAEPDNEKARFLLAQCLLFTRPEQVQEALSGLGADSDYADRAEALRVLAQALQEASSEEAGGDPFAAKFREGALALRRGDFAAALDAWIAVIERDKDWSEGKAKEACRAIFQLLGPRHPITEARFRAFSSAVHS